MSLKQAAFSGSRWTAASLLVRAGVQIAQTAILARLLAPADFGLMAIVAAAYAIVAVFVDLGLSNALIHFPAPTPAMSSTLYWLNLGAAVAMMLVFMVLAWIFAILYAQPELLSAMSVMSLSLPLAALGHQFCVIAEKELHFSMLAVIEVAAALCGFAAAVLVGWLGGGVYALIAASLVAAATSSTLAWWLLSKGLRPAFHFDLTVVRPYLRFGSYRLGDSLLNTLQSQADILIGGTAVGSAAMGVYTVPRNLALQLANTVVNPVVTRVGLPLMAKLQGDRAALKSIYLQTLRMTSSVNFPIYFALAIWADDLVAILLGSQWHQAGLYMRLFAAWGLIRSTGNPVGSLVYATGQVRRVFWWNLIQLLAVPGLLWLGVSAGGTIGLAASMVCTQLLIFYPLFRFLVHPACGAGFGEYVREIVPALVASTIAAALALAASSLFPQDVWGRVVVGAGTAGVAYVGASWFVNRAWLVAMGELLAPIVRRRWCGAA